MPAPRRHGTPFASDHVTRGEGTKSDETTEKARSTHPSADPRLLRRGVGPISPCSSLSPCPTSIYLGRGSRFISCLIMHTSPRSCAPSVRSPFGDAHAHGLLRADCLSLPVRETCARHGERQQCHGTVNCSEFRVWFACVVYVLRGRFLGVAGVADRDNDAMMRSTCFCC